MSYDAAYVGKFDYSSKVIADNQIDNATWFAENGIIELAGDVRVDDVGDEAIRILVKYRDCTCRKNLSRKMQKLVDGAGAERIAECLMNGTTSTT